MTSAATVDEAAHARGTAPAAAPGVIAVFSAGAPILRALPLGGDAVFIGRDNLGGAAVDDARMSRRHAALAFRDGTVYVQDCGSRNGTYADGQRLGASPLQSSWTPVKRVVRAGSTLLVPVPDVRVYLGGSVQTTADGFVEGPIQARAHSAIAAAAAESEVLLVRGESGAGKERAARTFHAHSPKASGPFVAVNCAAIPEGVAERLLFGAKRGAYSGAADADGYCAAADGGVLFLDEAGELSLDVQAKLLRFLETREFIPLGASRPRTVHVRVCAATHKDLRAAVAAGTFRADLYYRLAAFEVVLPPLRARPEEIPALILQGLSSRDPAAPGGTSSLAIHADFVEACVLRPWPGNVRELLGAVRRSVHAARATGVLEAAHLDPEAGQWPAGAPATGPAEADSGQKPLIPGALGTVQAPLGGADRNGAAPLEPETEGRGEGDDDGALRRRILSALERTAGNQTRAAELLGISRRTLVRRLAELGIHRPRAGSPAPGDRSEPEDPGDSEP